MSDGDDLAKRYLDLWREHISTIATDPQTVDTISRAFAAFEENTPEMNLAAMFPWLHVFPASDSSPEAKTKGGPDFDAILRAFTGQSPHANPAPRTKATSSSSDDGSKYLHELECRVTALEERIAKLEPNSGKSRRKDSRRTSKSEA